MIIRRFRMGLIALAMALAFCVLPKTAEAEAVQAEKIDIEDCGLYLMGVKAVKSAFDGVETSGTLYPNNSQMTIEYEEGIGSLYLIFDVEYGHYNVRDNDTDETIRCGGKGILHEFVDLEKAFGSAPKSVTITFRSGTVPLNEIYLFTPGEVPDYVQKWELPEDERADVVLFSTHADDEQLFFAGVLPYYAGELGYRVQVVYLTNHRNLTNLRCHEALNGLWSAGVTRYPLFGSYGDYYGLHSLKNGYDLFKLMHVSQNDLMEFAVEQIRRYKPQVAVVHDLEGEYGHNQHMVYADVLTRAAEISMDPTQYPNSAAEYGVWDVPKMYVHLYPENQITLDLDQPLERFGGMTAYQVTKYLGFPCHASQVKDFLWYMEGAEKAVDVAKFSPCYYGLYRTTVGDDVKKNDFFENLTTYDEQDRIAEEEALRAAEEARKQAEEAARAEAEKAAAIEAEAEAARQAVLQQQKKALLGKIVIAVGVAAGMGVLLFLASMASIAERRKK